MDEQPMLETLDTIAAKLTALGKSIDERFTKVDQQFTKVDQQFAKVDQQFAKVDQRFVTLEQEADRRLAEAGSHLGIKIEAVDDKVARVYDAVIALQKQSEANEKAHATFTKRLENHDIRILALEPPKSTGR